MYLKTTLEGKAGFIALAWQEEQMQKYYLCHFKMNVPFFPFLFLNLLPLISTSARKKKSNKMLIFLQDHFNVTAVLVRDDHTHKRNANAIWGLLVKILQVPDS